LLGENKKLSQALEQRINDLEELKNMYEKFEKE